MECIQTQIDSTKNYKHIRKSSIANALRVFAPKEPPSSLRQAREPQAPYLHQTMSQPI